MHLLQFEVVPKGVQDTYPEMAGIKRQLVDYMRMF